MDSGHGTHVATSVLGDGDAAGLGKGTAPAARLVFQATENYVTVSQLCASLYGYPNGYYLTGLPGRRAARSSSRPTTPARASTRTRGAAAAAGDYTVDSANADNFVWNHGTC